MGTVPPGRPGANDGPCRVGGRGDERGRTSDGSGHDGGGALTAPVVLVVDDDGVARSVVASVLRHAGMRTIEADSGRTALGVLSSRTVDAAVVDHTMPGMSGLELTSKLRETQDHRPIPILFLSSEDSAAVRIAALQAGATDFMVKPMPYDEIVARVESQLRLSSGWSATVQGLQERAATVVDLAGYGAEASPTVTARLICERISAAHGGTAVAVYSWVERSGDPCLLAATGDHAGGAVEAAARMARRPGAGPWAEPTTDWGGPPGSPPWLVGCPLWRHQVVVGMLVLGADSRSRDEIMAAGMDYAPTVSLLLGPALTESRRANQSRELVERTLTTGAFQPVFQPIVQVSTGRVRGYEALTRLSSGQPIVALLSEATEAGMRAECEMRLLTAALDQARVLDDVWVSVNLSPSVLVERTEEVGTVIAGSGCRVVIELTENERIEDYGAVRGALGRLGGQVRLSVDDTGAGYASLRHVVDLHPDFLKLDRSWVTGLDHDPTRQALVAGMVAFCGHTGTEMIAEGVETGAELAALVELDVHLAQGYLLGRPCPAGEVAGGVVA